MKSTFNCWIAAISPVLALLAVTAVQALAQSNAESPLGPGVPGFTVRPGYRVELVAEKIGEVRFLEFADADTLFVSQPRVGSIATLRKRDGAWAKVADFTTGKPTAHGMHFYDGWLWFTQSGAVWKARDKDGDGKADEEIKVIDKLPEGGGHWWRSIVVTTGGLYTSIGDSGNITDETATERQKIWKFQLDGTGKALFASGLRNNEKLIVRPGTGEIWGSDHGSDNYGGLLGEKKGMQPFTDRLPPEKFNNYVEGGFYGHPFIVGAGLPRLEYKDRPDFVELAQKMTLPAWTLPAHWAVNGWTFAQSDKLGLKGDAIMAAHGSWNSTVKVGYRVERILFDPMTQRPMGNQSLVITLSADMQVLGRPCDVAEAPDGSIFFSDDSKGRIYRITRIAPVVSQAEAPQPGAAAAPASATAPATAATTPQQQGAAAFTPLSYYQASCARCHGDYGATFGAQFRKKHSDEVLREKVLGMSEGQAAAPITEQQREQITDYMRSLRDGRPYYNVLKSGAGDTAGEFSGEAVPGSKLWITEGDNGAKRTDVALKGHSWSLNLAGTSASDRAVLHVEKGGSEVAVPLHQAGQGKN